MPARVHAVIVARPDGRGAGLAHLKSTLDAVASQSQPVDAITVVLCGQDPRWLQVINESRAEGVIAAPGDTGFAAAVALGSHRVEAASALWLLAQDTAPESRALEYLSGVLELAPSVAFAAPKLVERDAPEMIESLGVSMTRGGVAVELAEGQYDQGQHDGLEDVLGSDIRGVLLRAERRAELLPDPALAGADEGLDLGVRARLAGHRVSMAPFARVRVSADGVAGLPGTERAADRRRIAYATRVAQLHRRLAYAPAGVVPLHLLSFLPIVLWRTVRHLLAKAPAKVLPEWAATVVAFVRWGAIARSRSRLRGQRKNWWRVDQLRITRAEVQAILTSEGEPGRTVRPELRFFAGGGAWVVLASLMVSVLTMPMLLSASTLRGGGALPLRSSFAALWGDTGYGLLGYGVNQIGAADPFSFLVALIGSAMPAAPSTAFVVLWVLAMPLATLGGWSAATRITERSGLRIFMAVLWTLAPTFLASLVQPRPAAVLAHLLLPWLFFAGSVVHRSWAAAGAASLLLLAVTASSPALGAVAIVIVVAGFIIALVSRRLGGAARLVWTVVPTLLWFVPLAWRHLTQNNLIALLADPGMPLQGSRTDAGFLGNLALVAGFPDGRYGGAGRFAQDLGLADTLLSWAPLMLVLVAPVALVALFTPFVRRWRVGVSLLLVAATALTAAILVSGISVVTFQGVAVAVWPGALVSAGWLALGLAATLVFDGIRVPRASVAVAATLVGVLFSATAVPAVTAAFRGVSGVKNGPSTTLPAFVSASLTRDDGGGTLVLTVLPDGSLAQRVVWGASDTLGAQSTLVQTRPVTDVGDARLAAAIADIVTPGTGDRAPIAALGIRFVLVEPVIEKASAATQMRAQAAAAMDQNAALESVGEVGSGALWRVTGDVAERPAVPAASMAIGAGVVIVEVVIFIAALLLAIPTAASTRAARAKPRLIGERSASE